MSDHTSNAGYPTPRDAELAFYTAFVECDLTAMDGVWAHDGVSCVHPGAAVLIGRDAVMRSWRNILGDAMQPQMQVKLLRRTEGDTVAVHMVEERISTGQEAAAETALVLATNVYQRDAEGWRLLSHHASLVAQPPAAEAPEEPTLQ